MARIRSVHPGLWTDEAFVSLSCAARLFLIGLWTECDDDGCFAWKPLQLKMRLAPADNIDPVATLAEIEAIGAVKRFAFDDCAIGVVRNFRRFQKPEKPRPGMSRTDEMRAFAALDTNTHPGSGKPSPTVGGDSPTAPRPLPDHSGKVRADGGEGKGEEGKGGESARAARRAPERGSRIPPDFIPAPPTDTALAIAQRIGRERYERETARFKDHWSAASGASSIKRDWNAAFRLWLSRAEEYGPSNARGSPSGVNLC